MTYTIRKTIPALLAAIVALAACTEVDPYGEGLANSYYITPSQTSVALDDNGTASVYVEANDELEWYVDYYDYNYLSIPSSSHTGSNTLQIRAAGDNPSKSDVRTSVSLSSYRFNKSASFDVVIPGTYVSCTPSSPTFTGAGGNLTLAVQANAAWTLRNVPEWVSASQWQGSRGRTNITLTAEQNPSITDRQETELTFTAAGLEFSFPIRQLGAEAMVYLTTGAELLSPSSWESNNKGQGGTTSRRTWTITAQQGDVLSFTYSVSSESGYDKFTASLSGAQSATLVNGVSGTITNQPVSYTFPRSGNYTLTLSYSKDESYDGGDDMARVTDLRIMRQSSSTTRLTQLNVSAGGTAGENLTVVTNAPSWECSVAMDEDPSENWISAWSNGTNSLGLWIGENTHRYARHATVTVTAGGATATLRVTQAAADGYLTLSQSELTFKNDGVVKGYSSLRSYGITVTTNLSSWYTTKAYQNQAQTDWITVADQPQNNRFVVSASENTTPETRRGTITVHGDDGTTATLTVTQEPGTNIQFSPESLTFSATESNTIKSVLVTTDASSWTCQSNSSWITATKYGSNYVRVTVTRWTGTEDRTGTVTVTAGDGTAKSFTVTQTAATYFTLSPSTLAFTYNQSGYLYADVTTNAASWTVQSNNNWITATKSGNRVRVNVTQSSEKSTRTGTVTLTAGDGTTATLTVTQTAGTYFEFSPTALTFAHNETGTKTVAVTTNATSWTVRSNNTWLSATRSGSTIRVSVTALSGTTARTGSVTVTAGDGTTATFTVTQTAGTYFSFSPSSLSFGYNETGYKYVDVETNASSWTCASSATSWLTVVKSGSRIRVNVTSWTSTGTQPRNGTVTVTAGDGTTSSFTVSQTPRYSFTFSPSTVVFAHDETAAKTVGVTTNSPSWNYQSNDAWITVSRSGSTLTIRVTSWTGAAARTGSITFTAADGTTQTLSVRQNGTATNDIDRNDYGDDKRLD